MERYPTINLRFDRRHVATKTHPGTVEVLVSYQRAKLYVPTGVRVPVTQWKGERVVAHPQATTLNKQVADTLGRVTAAVSQLWNGGTFSLAALRAALSQRKDGGDPIAWITERIEEHPVSEGTRKHHRSLPKSLAAFGKIHSWADFTPTTIAAYDAWLRSRYDNIGTVRNYHKRLKVYLAIARRDGVLSRDPYDGFKVERPRAIMRRYLTDEQRDELERRQLSGALAHARDLFLWQCWTGMAYADMAAFDAKRDLVDEDGATFIIGSRRKTGTHFKVMLLGKALAILERYGGTLPLMSNQKYNYFLKIAAAGIRDDITSHMGRHTFATWALRNDVPIEVISAMLAHSDIGVTQIYAEQQQAHVNEQYRRLDKLANVNKSEKTAK